MDVLEKAQALEKEGKDIIHLEVGEPDFDTPDVVCEAAYDAMKKGRTHYTNSLGLPELRQAICEHYHETYGVDVDSDQIVVTSGTSPAMLMIFNALLEQGDEVIISDPCYACYENFICFTGGKAVRIPVREEDAFQYRPEEIKAKMTAKTKGVMINSPANPTGQVMSAKRMKAIADLAPGADGPPFVISDEIYHGLSYGETDHSILEFTKEAFVMNGFSKLYAMTGWRLGYIIAPKSYMRALQKMHQNFAICAPSMCQWAGIAALTQTKEETERMKEKYNARRVRLVEGLRQLGLGIKVPPTGAFYVLAKADHLDPDDYRLAFHILENAGVAVTPGCDFGPGGKGYLRFSYANSLDNIDKALRRLGDYIKRFYS
jgi:aspartate/methionine/tyrosine aminotransferase